MHADPPDHRLLADRRGLSTLEYALLFVVICVGSLAFWHKLGRNLYCQMTVAEGTFTTRLGGSATGDQSYCSDVLGNGGAGGLGSSNGQPPPVPPGQNQPPHPPPPPPPPPPPAVTTGLGAAVDALVGQSPTLTHDLQALQANGWTVRYGHAGETGSFSRRDQKVIVIDPSEQGQPAMLAQTLAHEAGHAQYTPSPYVPPSGLTKAQYVQRNVDHNLADEGAATLENMETRAEILQHGGPDIGIAGTQPAQYQQIYNQYKAGTITSEQARNQIGNVYGNGEHTSTTGEAYGAYYGHAYETQWNQSYAGKPPGFVAP
ncbi:MAG TPA: hypothetical protein VHZ95_09870 [Polyangiales bacterium]|nr:hypothetical protein [Polyangiales bacterium]